VLEVRAVGQNFGRVAALRDVSFTIGDGEIVGLIGPNGAGKTTLVNLISGILPGWTGDVLFRGRSIRGLKPYRIGHLGISRTFQIAQPFGNMTTIENVMVGAMFGQAAGRETVWTARGIAEGVLEFVGLEAKADVPAESLNVPERKRLEMARALAMNPTLLLLDEVMAGLNRTEVARAVELIKRIRNRGVAILVIEHVMKAIVSLSDRIVVLHHGERIMAGTPDVVLSDARVIDAYLGARYRRRAASAGPAGPAAAAP
jgi:branched-chain amino acid transport system ATP-binding protein